MKHTVVPIAVSVAVFMIPSLIYARADRAFYHAIRYGATAKFTVKIVDDIKQPVGGVKIEARFDPAFSAAGELKTFVTDTNGMALVSGRTGKSVSVRATKNGYYGSTEEIGYVSMGQGVKGGMWQPLNMTREIVLRPIKKPAAVKVPVGNWRIADATNQWIGFDIEKYDFVKPHGKGMIADMDVRIDWDGRRWPNSTGMEVYIRFPEKYAGGYYQDRVMGSDFKDSYFALTNATYMKEFSFFEHPIRDARGDIERFEKKTFDLTKVLIVRSRCVLDENGRLKEARYCQISNFRFSCDDGGGCIMFQPIFNPTPNDTNLEPKR